MKLVIITQDDPIYIGSFFRRFFPLLQQNQWIKLDQIIVNTTLRTESSVSLLKRIYPLYRLKGLIILAYRKIMLFIWNRIPVAVKGNRIRSLEDGSRLFAVRLVRGNNINNEETLRYLRETSVDLVLSVAAAQIFGKELLSIPKYGCVNIHCGKLPEYRGMLPSFWQMYYGEKRLTISVHYMGEKIDNGDLIYEDYLPIDPRFSLDYYMRKAKEKSADVIINALQKIKDGTIQKRPLNMGNARYFSFPDAKAAMEFLSKGYRVI